MNPNETSIEASSGEEFLNFDEAVELLRTTPSTLYKWLQADKIPAHKLGRQWRFVRRELEAHMSEPSPNAALRARRNQEITKLAEFLSNRRSKNLGGAKPSIEKREEKVQFEVSQLAERLIWDAVDHQRELIHITPRAGRYELNHRTRTGLEQVTELSEDLFTALDDYWREHSLPHHREDSRRVDLFRENPTRNSQEVVQVRYEKLQTAHGPRILLRLWSVDRVAPQLDQAVKDESARSTFLKWFERGYGIIVIAGGTRSGKTTTTLSVLRHLQEQNLAVFSIEDVAEILIDGVQHVELARRSADAFNETFERVYASDPDVIAMGMGELGELEPQAFQAALRAAKSGHLVVLHLAATSHDEVAARMRQALGSGFEDHLLGISIQVIDESAKRARYVLQEFAT